MKRQRIQFKSTKPSRTQQHLKQECDINSILERYRKTGQITHVKSSPGQYGDFSQYRDFQSNLNLVKDAHDHFASLPAQIRKRFQNDPAQLIEFAQNHSNSEEAVALGLSIKRPDQKPDLSNDDKTTINEAKPDQGIKD